MEIFEPLLKEVNAYNEFIDYVEKEDDLSLSGWSNEQIGFTLYAISEMENSKMLSKLIHSCLTYKTWGLLIHLLTESSSQKGVITWTLNNYDQLPEELQAGIVAIVCYGNKWANKKLNSLFFELIKKLVNSSGEQNTDEETVDIYYPLGWNESIIDAIHNPCWYSSKEDAFVVCFYSKLYFCRSLNLKNDESYVMFGRGERKDVDCIKTYVLRATVKKRDIVATMTPEILNIGFLPVRNLIFDQILDVELVNADEMHFNELSCLQSYLDEKSTEVTDETVELYDKMLLCCEKAGLPSFTDPEEVTGKVLQKPNEIAKMLRLADRMKLSEAMSIAKRINKGIPGGKWTCTYGVGYKTKLNYYYSCICYSPFSCVFQVVIGQYMGKTDFKLTLNDEQQRLLNGMVTIVAIDYETESETFEEYREKVRRLLGQY